MVRNLGAGVNCLRIVVLGMLVLLVFTARISAITVDLMFKEIDRVSHRFDGLKFPPLDVVLVDAHRAEYDKRRELGHCGYASFLLLDSFLSRRPGIEEKRKITRRTWRLIVQPRHYPELAHCEAMELISNHRAKINEAGLESKPLRQRGFWSEQKKGGDPRIGILTHLQVLIALALENYPPAQVSLAELSAEAVLIRLTPAFAYVMLTRAKAAGHDDPKLEGLLADATAALGETARQALAPIVASDDWPREWPIVRD